MAETEVTEAEEPQKSVENLPSRHLGFPDLRGEMDRLWMSTFGSPWRPFKMSEPFAHMPTATVTFTLAEVGGTVSSKFADDGVGFDTTEIAELHRGLRNMESRAKLVRASIEIQSAAGAGTRVKVSYPMDKP